MPNHVVKNPGAAGSRSAGFAPKVVVVIPVFKHPGLLAEAVESVLAQRANFDIATVIVDDGCPFPETADVGQAYALAHPNAFYTRKPNGGLSSARNHGIEYALRYFPELEAIYLLDADNRITPSAIKALMDFLVARPGIDWVYPNIDKFGIAWAGNYTAEYSRLLHLTFDNICEAGSLVSRRLIDAGIRFDETMKAGFEDWDFWLQALGKGFRGANHPYFGFEYRQRAESMLRDSNRTRDAILSYIRQKHKALFETQSLLACEHSEAPRYGLVNVGTYLVEAFTDPNVEHELFGLDEFVRRFWAARSAPDTYGIPSFLTWIADTHRRALTRLGLIHNVFWQAEQLAEQYNFVAIRFEVAPSKIEFKLRAIDADMPLRGKITGWVTSKRILQACVDDPTDDWARSLRNAQPSPSVVELVISAPFNLTEVQSTPLSPTNTLLATLGALRDSSFRNARPQKWIWRESYLPERSRYYELTRAAAGASPLMPRLSRPDKKLKVGMLLPIASFGGVEKVAYALARVLKSSGCEVHLFILGRPVYDRHADNDDVFASINFLAADYPLWGGPHTYAGHDLLMESDASAQAPRLMGLLSGLDVVINNQVASVNSVLGSLRRQGVKVLNYVHVLDRSQHGRDAGHPYLSLAFEHVYDAILTCSRDMVEWLHAMGTPAAKLMHVRNAPSFDVPEAECRRIQDHRRTRTAGNLRVLFLGRFDAQKGIERLHSIARELQRRDVGVEWQVVGKDVIDAGAGTDWTRRFKDIGIAVKPPMYASSDLAKAFAWADVVVLPSRWEGAPLTILEAQRLGCVPVATAVGAVEELIDHDADGLLVRATSEGRIVDEFVDFLSGLALDRASLARLSDAAAARTAKLDWKATTQPVLDQLATWFPDRFERARKQGPRLIRIESEARKAAAPTLVDRDAQGDRAQA